MKLLRFVLVALLLVSSATVALPDDCEAEQLRDKNNASWKAEIEKKIAANPRLKALSDRLGYHFIHSKTAFKNDSLNWCAFSFTYNTGDEAQHQGDVQLIFHQSNPMMLDVNPRTTCANQIADLGKVDILKDVNPRTIDIAGDAGWSSSALAKNDHVYLVRVKDDAGSRYFALVQVVHVDPKGDYVAFFYRLLDGKKLGLPEDKLVKRASFKN